MSENTETPTSRPPTWAEKRWQEFILVAGLLTRLPVPPHPKKPFVHIADGLWAFPIIGIIIGVLSALAYWLMNLLGLPASLCAAAALFASACLSGLLHEDGLSDFADGAGGGTRDVKLAIMHDSRTGTYGTYALVVTVLARWAALTAFSLNTAILALIAAHMIGRGSLALHYWLLKPVRTDGIAANAGHPPEAAIISCLVITTVGVALLLPPSAVFLVLITSLLAALLFAWITRRAIEGYTGDTLGSAEQITEIVVLWSMAAIATSAA